MATSTDLRAAIQEVQSQIPEEQLPGMEGELLAPESWESRIERRVGALPWWVISSVVHAVLFLLATLIGVAVPPPSTDEVVITSDIAKKQEPKFDEKKKRDIFRNPQEVKAETQVENPVVVHEQTEITDHFETDNNMDSQSARGSEDAISDIPLGGTGVTGSMGVGGGGMAGCFGYRGGGGRKKAVGRFGGSKATESAVEAALRWLVRHQNADGSWNSVSRNGKRRASVGMTGLATLAFLGAGHTSKAGKYRDNVARAVKYIVKDQRDDGCIGAKGTIGYLHSIAGLALVEAYGMSKDESLRGPAQKAVDYTRLHQDPYGGWRYRPKQAGDISVTGWFVMQLKSAKVAGLKVDGACFQGAMNFVGKTLDRESGVVGYRSMPKGKASTSANRRESMSLVCQLFMGVDRNSEVMRKVAKWPHSGPPTWKRPDYYYWYYATLGMFQMGGDYWKDWNKQLKPTLVNNQRKGGPLDGSVRDVDGSWDPIGKGGTIYAGRVMSTALGALCLEVYYRYLPMYSK